MQTLDSGAIEQVKQSIRTPRTTIYRAPQDKKSFAAAGPTKRRPEDDLEGEPVIVNTQTFKTGSQAGIFQDIIGEDSTLPM